MDYWNKLDSLDRQKLADEAKRLNETLWKIYPGSPIRDQILSMIDQVRTRQSELLFVESRETTKKSEIIELGSIDSTTYTPDYSSENLLIATVTMYTK